MSWVLRRLDSQSSDFEDQMRELGHVQEHRQFDVEEQVRAMITRVRVEGDAALLDLTAKFDRLSLASAADLEIPASAWETALHSLPPGGIEALQQAADRIRHYHEQQRQASWRYQEADGTWLGQQITALDRVGIYVPGGKAAYPSSVLMNAIPARVAGVGEIIMVVPTPGGDVNPWVLAAAHVAGVDRVFRIGGAQAVAALAYGTAVVPAVDKIVGPGNIYVATAKRQVFGQVGIDMIAGPSEILVFADASAPAAWLAMDLFSQAEHDEQAQSLLISEDVRVLDAVERAMRQLLPGMQRRSIIEASLQSRAALIQVPDRESALRLINRIAPEHLQLACVDAESLLPGVRHAGAIFLGIHTPEALGDYCAGPNHVLPTSGSARFSSPLGVYDFQKRSSLISVSQAAATKLGHLASTLARAEGLEAHARSAEFRIQD
ncbi:MAG: histidinol dehydrogenase [Pseudomonadales bacterium]|nr:histidinol dehydrogenase [Pseudomonadales bacterium]